MDAVQSINIHADSSFVLGLEAQARGYELWYYLPQAMSYEQGHVYAQAFPLKLQNKEGAHYSLGAQKRCNLADIDVILMRQDPPFDMQYIGATHLLEKIHPKTLVVNNPVAVRNAPEKLLVTHFAHFMPETLITFSLLEAQAFRKKHSSIIVKPLFGNGDAGVFHIKPDDENLSALFEMHLASSREPLMVQRYLPEIRQGDKRIILVDGEPIGAINRIPSQGEARANLHVGGRAEACTLSDKDREVCQALKPMLQEQNLIFVGIDMIGDYLTEINVTSPTGLQELKRFDNTDGAALIWDAIARKLEQNQ